jgi:hypothetical protein
MILPICLARFGRCHHPCHLGFFPMMMSGLAVVGFSGHIACLPHGKLDSRLLLVIYC